MVIIDEEFDGASAYSRKYLYSRIIPPPLFLSLNYVPKYFGEDKYDY
jgi:hypothetical protein